ncbi:uncharacterized protein MYCFIDRAFT_171661 [Pseudocercospora fijiensis CIRAD86]|uniref:Uncharacterized protein n=1 Tax=Pseudocercospora fijiensis (strain CIRAD86) TaxID=383855 RepID=M2Z7R2_PSEFD|nr:uncharacterized protein MYCFIDRAFT_171661 [Pseudocercospora fijiensis CIRAD86]EME85785.1 hypothetical protein MYCFIDRAFT_171661 [Pseudocercospora fijiensis CIRAD86]
MLVWRLLVRELEVFVGGLEGLVKMISQLVHLFVVGRRYFVAPSALIKSLAGVVPVGDHGSLGEFGLLRLAPAISAQVRALCALWRKLSSLSAALRNVNQRRAAGKNRFWPGAAPSQDDAHVLGRLELVLVLVIFGKWAENRDVFCRACENWIKSWQCAVVQTVEYISLWLFLHTARALTWPGLAAPVRRETYWCCPFRLRLSATANLTHQQQMEFARDGRSATYRCQGYLGAQLPPRTTVAPLSTPTNKSPPTPPSRSLVIVKGRIRRRDLEYSVQAMSITPFNGDRSSTSKPAETTIHLIEDFYNQEAFARALSHTLVSDISYWCLEMPEVVTKESPTACSNHHWTRVSTEPSSQHSASNRNAISKQAQLSSMGTGPYDESLHCNTFAAALIVSNDAMKEETS